MVKIRRAVAADTGAAIDLMNELENTFNFNITSKDKNLAKFEHYIANNQYIIFLAEDEQNQAQGIITLSPVITFYAEGEMGMIHELYVHEGFRATGAATQLMNAAKHYAEEQGWQVLELSTPTHSNNESAKAFYKKSGFEDFGIHFYYETSHCS